MRYLPKKKAFWYALIDVVFDFVPLFIKSRDKKQELCDTFS
jgi:hypothetical protein